MCVCTFLMVATQYKFIIALAFIKSVAHARLCYDKVAEKQVAAFGMYSHITYKYIYMYIYTYMCVCVCVYIYISVPQSVFHSLWQKARSVCSSIIHRKVP